MLQALDSQAAGEPLKPPPAPACLPAGAGSGIAGRRAVAARVTPKARRRRRADQDEPRRPPRATRRDDAAARPCRERLVQSQSVNAILTTFNEVNMAPVMEMRKRFQEKFEKEHGVKLGFMSFFVRRRSLR